GAQSRDVLEGLSRFEHSVRIAMLNDALRQPRTDSRHSCKQRRGGRVDVDADGIDAVLDDRIERACQISLGQIVLILPDADRLRIDLHQLGQRVLKTPGDRHRAAHGHVELPELDVTMRGAVSIARRLQDPLAELVKIDPKAIGVGQYQHDLAQGNLARSLDTVVEDCVNAVGVDVNTASAPLLARVSGIGPGLAQGIVQHRDANGVFKSRKALKDVPRLGAKAFEQCAGFLRINGGDDPLDASGVHPEAYPVVRRILASTKSNIKALIGNSEIVRQLKPQAFVDDTFGLPTVTDILRELEKPGRDPRPAFKAA